MTDRGKKHEGMPNRILKAQALPHMKDNAHRVQHAACREKPESKGWERGNHGFIGHHATPTQKQIENNRNAIEAAW